MPTYQTGKNYVVSIKAETTAGTIAAGGAGATQLRTMASPGLGLNRAQILSQEIRSDALKAMGRLGFKGVAGSFNGELSLATFDLLFAAIQRCTTTAALTSSQADFTSVTTGANSIIGASGSFITKGFKVGDVVVLNATGGPAGNNNTNIRLTSVTANTLGTAETLTVDSTARTTFTLNRGKKWTNPSTIVRQSFTIEQYLADIGKSETFLGCRLVGLKLSCKPGAFATVQLTFAGMDRSQQSSQYFTTPTLSTGIGLVADDSTIRYNGADVATFTGLDLDFSIANKAEPVIGNLVPIDVFDNELTVTGSITALRSDLTHLTAFDAETEFETQVLFVEPTTQPKNYINVFLPRSKFADVNTQLGNDGPQIITLPIMTGAKAVTTGYDAGVVMISTNAP